MSGQIDVNVVSPAGVKLNVDAAGNVATVPAGPAGAKFYVHAMADVPGVVAANNFLSVFNPSGSTKNVVFYLSNTVAYATGATSVTSSMNVFRITAASVGTQVTGSTIGRFVTADPDPQAEVRTGNPTVTTVGNTLLGTPPAVTSAAGGASASAISSIPPGAGFFCTPGQGIVFRTTAGNVNQLWNIQVVWAEL